MASDNGLGQRIERLRAWCRRSLPWVAVPFLLVPLVSAALALNTLFMTSRELAGDARWVVGRFHSDVLYHAIALADVGETVDVAEAQRLQVDVAILRNRLFVVDSGATRRLLLEAPGYPALVREAEDRIVAQDRLLRPVAEGGAAIDTARLRPGLERLQAIAEELVVRAVARAEAVRADYLQRLGLSLSVAAGSLLLLIGGALYFLRRAIREGRRLTETLAAKESAEGWQRKLLKALDQSPAAVLLADRDGHVEYVNRALLRLDGRREGELVGYQRGIASSLPGSSVDIARIREAVMQQGDWQQEQRNVRPDGSVFWEHVRVTPIRTDGEHITHLLAIKEDITARKVQEAEVMRHAYYDALTGLPNRVLALDRLERAVARTLRGDRHAAVLFVDLDDFKTINDTFGHDRGDALLADVAERLASAVRAGDTVARLGGDEFLIIAEDIDDEVQVQAIADKLIDVFRHSFTLDGQDFYAAGSLGYAIAPEDARDARTVLRHADTAMYRAKSQGKNTWAAFASAVSEDSGRRLALEHDLRGALERGELAVHYQPQVSLTDGRLIGAEALLRWHHPTLGDVPLDQFIPLAESLGLIVPIGRWVLERALVLAAACRRERPDFRVAVNLSPRQAWAEGLAEQVHAALGAEGLDPGVLTLEVTENLFIGNRDQTGTLLARLRDSGVRLAIDDFGTGYASLNYLKRFPVSVLKIDRTFIHDIEHSPDDRMLVQSIIAMAAGLGLEVIAEGVETDGQWRLLGAAGCDVAQGFLMGAATGEADFRRRFLAVETVYTPVGIAGPEG